MPIPPSHSSHNQNDCIMKVKFQAVTNTGLIRLLVSFFLLTIFTAANAQTVTGTVLDEESKPVNGATVTVKGTNKATTTNASGNFSINAAGTDVLVITFIGFTNLEVPLNGRTTVSVTLTPAETNMEEVVVIALGEKRAAKKLGYATTTVNAEELVRQRTTTLGESLVGKVAGLNMVRSGSGPTASNKIILRGENNLTGDNEALIVVDGVVINQGSGRRSAIGGEVVYGVGSDNMPADYGSSVNDINPDDIEKISVLKGAGATALYGSRASGGVIIITTKSGQRKDKGLGITYNMNYSVDQVNRWPDYQFEYGEGRTSAYYSYLDSEDGANTSTGVAAGRAWGPKFNGQQYFRHDV